MARIPLLQSEALFLTDGGLETDMMFHRGVQLPFFASVNLLRNADGRAALDKYFRSYLMLARKLGTGFELVSASWRASPDWAGEFGISQHELDELNAKSVEMLLALQAEFADVPTFVTGCIGPRGDGYDPGRIMTVEEAQDYHRRQATVLAAAGAEMIGAMTITNIPEATGITRAAQALHVPAYISFTVETDGRLPTGDSLESAVAAVDEATGAYPVYYMVNCAHPTHFGDVLVDGGQWVKRIGGIRANASRCSHAELEAMTELDDGNPAELGQEYSELVDRLPHLKVLGGCCGTDIRHIAAIAERCAPVRAAA